MKLLRLLPRFRRAYRELSALERRERWARAEIEAFQLERLNAVWAHAISYVSYYRALKERLRLPPRFASLDEYRALVPVLPKAVVRERGGELLSERAAPGHWDFSSGSTGTPTRFYWGADAHREMLRAKYRFLASWDLDIFDRTVFLWGRSSTFEPGLGGLLARVRQPVLDRARNRLRLPAYELGRDDLRRNLRQIAGFCPVALYAYVSAAYLLAQEAQAVGCRPESLRLAILSAEPVLPHVRQAVEGAFGVPAVSEYGSVESVLIAAEGPDRALRVREDNILLETLPGEDGRYDIVLTVLNNPSFPLLRYAIGDSTGAPLSVPAIGFAVLEGVVGRQNDLVISRSGRPLHPILFDEIFSRHPAVRSWRVHQHADGALSVQVELRSPGAALHEAELAGRVREQVEGYPVHVEVVPEVPRTAAGKHRWVQSELSAAGRS